MTPGETEDPQDTFRQREGGALLCMGVIAVIQILLAINVLYFMDGRSASDRTPDNAPILRPSIHAPSPN
jgi:hypothetical protein